MIRYTFISLHAMSNESLAAQRDARLLLANSLRDNITKMLCAVLANQYDAELTRREESAR